MTSWSKTVVFKVSWLLLEGCFDFGSFSQKFMICLILGHTSMSRSATATSSIHLTAQKEAEILKILSHFDSHPI